MKVSIKKSTFFEYIIAIAIILDCNSVWNNLIETRRWFQLLVVAMLCLGVVGFIGVSSGIPKKLFQTSVVIIPIYYIIYYVFGGNSILQTTLNLLISSLLICIYFVTKKKKGNISDLLICFKNIIVLLATVSLFFWLFGSVLEIVQPTGSSLTNWTGNNNQTVVKSYFGIYYSYQNIWFFDKLHIVRNISIFNEAPMSALFFSMGLLIELLFEKNFNKKKCMVLILAILSTLSTSGYIVASMACVYKYIRSNKQNSFFRYLKVLFIPVLLCVVLIVATTLLQEKLSTFSGMARSDDFISGIRAWLLHPIFGDGIGNMEAMTSVRPSWRKDAEGFNSGFIQLLVQGGVYLALPYMYAISQSLRKSVTQRNYEKGMFIILFTFIFFITVIAFNYVTLMIIWFLAIDNEFNTPRRKIQ